MRYLLLSIIYFSCFAALALGGGNGGGGNNDNLRDVCIIGGGGSGSAAAVFLRDLNKDVVIIESQSTLGGHCDTVRFPGGWNEAGVVVYPDTTFATAAGCGPWDFDMKSYAKRFAGNDSILPAFFDGLPGFIGDYSTGFFLGPTPPVPITQDFLTDYARLANLMRTELLFLDTLLDVPTPIPASFRVSFNEWIAANNFTSIYSTFLYPLYYAGLGDFDRLTAWDGLLQRSCTNLLADTPGAWFSVKNGCQSIYDGILNFLGGERVRFNATVTQVVRPRRVNSRKPIIVRGTQVGRNGRPFNFVERCRNLIVSIPPTLENLTPFMDLTFFERQLFRDISTRFYFSGTYDVSGGIATSSGNYTFTNVNVTSPLGLPVFPAVATSFRKFPAGPGVIQSYSTDPISTSDMKAIVQGQLNNVQAGGAFTSISNLKVFPHRYNPHWSREALGNPFLSPYDQWDQLQGLRSTFYIGAARHTPSSAVIINYVKKIVEEYFD